MNTKKYIDTYKGIIIYFGLNIGISFLISIFLPKTIPFLKNPWFLSIINLIAPLITCIVLIICYQNIFHQKFQDFKTNFVKYLNIMIKYYLAGFLLMIVTNSLISSITKTMPQNEIQNRTLFNSLPLYSIISSIFLAPITEEIVFRASFKDLPLNINLKSLISALIFGLLHVIFNGDILFAIPFAALGYFLARTYYETDNIYTSISIHMFHNILCLFVLFIFGGSL